QTTRQMRVLQVEFTATSAAMLAVMREQAGSSTASAAALQDRHALLADRLAAAADQIVHSSSEFGRAAANLVATVASLDTRLSGSAESLIQETTGTRELVRQISTRLSESGGDAVIRELGGMTERVDTIHRDLSNLDS